eukprot:564952-Rhodomonas_salina.3
MKSRDHSRIVELREMGSRGHFTLCFVKRNRRGSLLAWKPGTAEGKLALEVLGSEHLQLLHPAACCRKAIGGHRLPDQQ